MKRGDALELCNALREIAASLETLLAQPAAEDLDAPLANFDLLETALVELAEGLADVIQLPVPSYIEGCAVCGGAILADTETWPAPLCEAHAPDLDTLFPYTEQQCATLEALGRSHGYRTPLAVVNYLVSSMCDGVRRPGSWERGCVEMLFGGAAILEAVEGS